MNRHLELRRDGLLISTDPARLDLDAVCGFLSRSYWASARSRERIEASIRNSLVFGAYDGERQVGLARIVTDYATFAWLCDVFIDEGYRGRGVGKWLMEAVVSHPDLQSIKRILLVTADAHGLYEQYGFTPLAQPQKWMELFREGMGNT